jgi:hypothetical protein
MGNAALIQVKKSYALIEVVEIRKREHPYLPGRKTNIGENNKKIRKMLSKPNRKIRLLIFSVAGFVSISGVGVLPSV